MTEEKKPSSLKDILQFPKGGKQTPSDAKDAPWFKGPEEPEDDLLMGECRRYPPVVICGQKADLGPQGEPLMVPDLENAMMIFPRTPEDMECGEWRAREKKGAATLKDCANCKYWEADDEEEGEETGGGPQVPEEVPEPSGSDSGTEENGEGQVPADQGDGSPTPGGEEGK